MASRARGNLAGGAVQPFWLASFLVPDVFVQLMDLLAPFRAHWQLCVRCWSVGSNSAPSGPSEHSSGRVSTGARSPRPERPHSPGPGRGGVELPAPPLGGDRAPLAKRGQPSGVTAYAWAAQCRLCSRFRQLAARREHNRGGGGRGQGAGRVQLGHDDRPRGRGVMKRGTGGRAPRKDPRGRYAAHDPRS